MRHKIVIWLISHIISITPFPLITNSPSLTSLRLPLSLSLSLIHILSPFTLLLPSLSPSQPPSLPSLPPPPNVPLSLFPEYSPNPYPLTLHPPSLIPPLAALILSLLFPLLTLSLSPTQKKTSLPSPPSLLHPTSIPPLPLPPSP